MMELYARIFILCLLCVARASVVPPEEIAEIRALTHIGDFSKIAKQEPDGLDGQSTENPRDKRALGLLLSGLAQIFGYTVTPIQFATLPNSNVTRPTATSNASKTVNAKQQAAFSQSANTTVPKQQETIRFTGVLNFGNNSDILGHLQRYEQIFHSRNNTTSQPSMPVPPAKISVDPRTNPQMRPPLLAPFFVKIPLPIAPDLLPLPVPVENLGLSNLSPPVSVVNDLNENTEAPVRKEQEMVYRNNEDTERYMVEEKDIYNEKDVRKPTDKYNHQLYVDEQKRNKQQDDRHNELQRKEEERIKKLKQQEEERNRDKAAHYNKEEVDERYRNHEKEITDRNRDRASQEQSTEERRPAHDDEEDEGSAERYKEYVSQENLSNESPKQTPNKKEEIEDYPNYDDDSSKQFNGYKQPVDLDKYVDIVYNRQLPIGDYFHERNPEVIRDSYGEILDNKKLEDDRIAGYVSMFKQPYVQDDAYDSQRGHNNPEDASREENGKETSVEDGYDEHLIRLQKLREEYALPENKYEEYDLNDESEADRNDRESERTQNHTSVRAKTPGRPVTGRGKEDSRARRPTGSNRNEAARLENQNSQEADFARYMPLVVPIRYIDANDKMQQATTRQLQYKEADKSTDSAQYREGNVSPAQTVFNEKLALQIGLPERPRQLHEGEHKELQVWPPPFDYAFDNTEPVSTIVSPNSQNYYPRTYAPNYYQHVKEVAAQDAKDKSTEQPSGYLVVVSNPTYPYRYPYNIYYFSNEAVNSRSQEPHPHAEVTRPRDQVYIAQQSARQQTVQAKPNITEYNLNETTNSPLSQDYYYQSQVVPASALDRYRYTFGERTPQVKEPFNVDVKSPILNNVLPTMENWSNRIYRPPSKTIEEPPRPVFVPLQNIASSNQNAQNGPSERPHHSRLLRTRKSLRSENYRKNDEEAQTPQPILKNLRPEDHRKDDEEAKTSQTILKNLQPEDHRKDDKEAKTPSRPIQKNLQPEDHRKDDEEAKTPQPILRSKSFDDPQSAHDFFGFSKDDYNFESESNDATKVTEENGKTVEESDALDAPEPTIYHYDDESIVKHTDEPENDTEKAKVTEYRNKVATLRVSERRQLKPNGPIHYVDFTRNI